MPTSHLELNACLLRYFEYLGKDLSANTIAAYTKDGMHFYAFWKANGTMDVTRALLISYFDQLALEYAFASIARKYIAIRHVLNLHDIVLSQQDQVAIKMALSKHKRVLGSKQKQAKAFRIEEFKAAIEKIDVSTWKGCRNKALLLLGFVTASRRSELCYLKRSDITFCNGYAIISLSRSKTNPYGELEQKAVFAAEEERYCPIQSLKDWLLYVPDDAETPLFFAKHSHSKALSNQSVNRIVKKVLGDAYSAHSLRVSFVTIAKRNNVQDSEILQQTKHKDSKMIARYTQLDNIIDHNAAKKLGL